MNKKGFTMVELLAAVTIIGILTAVAVPATYKYIYKARGQSEETVVKSAYEASVNYMINKSLFMNVGDKKTIKISTLVEEDFLEPVKDPVGNNGGACYGGASDAESYVEVTKTGEGVGGTEQFSYRVHIKCPSGLLKEKTF